MIYHIAIDSGRYAPKIVMEGGYRDWFPAYVGTGRELKLKNNYGDTDISIKTGDGWFFLGDRAKLESKDGARLRTISKLHIHTKLFVLAAIGRAILNKKIPNGAHVIVTIGVPVDQFDREIKKQLHEMLVTPYVIEINDELINFMIQDINLSVEGVSAYKLLSNNRKGTNCFIDIGSRTVNFGVVIDGKYINQLSGTLQYGYTDRWKSKELSNKVFADLSEVWTDFSQPTYLLGGGAIYCSTDFMNHFSNLRCAVDPIFLNALTFWTIGEEMNGKLEKQTSGF